VSASVGNRVPVTGSLIDSNQPRIFGDGVYDRVSTIIFAIQDEVTEAVVVRVAEGIKGASAPSMPDRALRTSDRLRPRGYRHGLTERIHGGGERK
jgi:hypothetical protein